MVRRASGLVLLMACAASLAISGAAMAQMNPAGQDKKEAAVESKWSAEVGHFRLRIASVPRYTLKDDWVRLDVKCAVRHPHAGPADVLPLARLYLVDSAGVAKACGRRADVELSKAIPHRRVPPGGTTSWQQDGSAKVYPGVYQLYAVCDANKELRSPPITVKILAEKKTPVESKWSAPVDGLQFKITSAPQYTLKDGRVRLDVKCTVKNTGAAPVSELPLAELYLVDSVGMVRRCQRSKIDARGWAYRPRKVPPGGTTSWQQDGRIKTGPGVYQLYAVCDANKKLKSPAINIRIVPAEAPWGEAVNGVHVRLRAAKRQWQAGETPKLLTDFRNMGQRDLRLVLAPEWWEIQVDGQWYRATVIHLGRVDVKPLGPGAIHENIAVPLDERWGWKSKEGNKPLTFASGKHTVRVAFDVHPAKVGDGKPVHVVSNPVEIQVVAAKANVEGDHPVPAKPIEEVGPEPLPPHHSEPKPIVKKEIGPWVGPEPRPPPPPPPVPPQPGQDIPAADVPAYVPRKGLVALWRAEGNAKDSLGRCHGKLMGGAGIHPGRGGRVFHFDGRGDWVEVADHEVLRITGDLTISMWICPDDVPSPP